jgi:thiamine-monophosphate kinase
MRHVFFSPSPRIPEAQYLNTHLDVTSMTDLSDGLSTDLEHITTSSGVGAVLFEETLPVSEEAVEVSGLLCEESLGYVLNGGEDYELLFTTRGGLSVTFAQEFKNRFGIPVTMIGRVLDSGLFIEGSNKVRSPLVPGGFDHLRRRVVDADRGD